MIKSYKEAIKYLESFIDLGLFNRIDPNTPVGDHRLNRIRIFLKKIGNPNLKFPTIIVSGTSGKGSTAYLIANMLVHNNYKVGLTISPHLQKMNERIQIGDKNKFLNSISDQEFVDLLNSIYSQLEEMKHEKEGSLSFPEILFCMALKYYADQNVDIAICEVGLESRYDFTSVLSPIGFVLTNISLDHTRILGDTVEKIADESTAKIEKLKISNTLKMTKELRPFVVSGVLQKSIIDLVKKRSKESDSELYLLKRDFDYKVLAENEKGVGFEFESSIRNQELLTKGRDSSALPQNDKILFSVSLLGSYQAENTSLAIETVLNLRKFGFSTNIGKIKDALTDAFWPGRFEIIKLHNKSTLILDGAHNVVKMSSFLKSLKKYYPKNPKIFICAFKKDKDISKMLEMILKQADYLILTKFESTIDFGAKMSEEVENLNNVIVQNEKIEKNIFYEKNAKRALKTALDIVKKFDFSTTLGMTKIEPLIVTTGSLYLVGEIRELLSQQLISK